jgi:tagatose 6-phosphate kinase
VVTASGCAGGLLAVTPDGTWRTDCADPGGAPVVAGLLSGLATGAPWPDRLARAAALSAADGEFSRAEYDALRARVQVTELVTVA